MMLSPLLTVYTALLTCFKFKWCIRTPSPSIRLTCEEQLPSVSANTELQSAEVNCQWPPSDRHLPWWSAWTSSVVEKLMRKNIDWFCLSIKMYCTLIYNWTYLEIPPLFSVFACRHDFWESRRYITNCLWGKKTRPRALWHLCFQKLWRKLPVQVSLLVQATPYQTLISSKIRWGSLSSY